MAVFWLCLNGILSNSDVCILPALTRITCIVANFVVTEHFNAADENSSAGCAFSKFTVCLISQNEQ